MTATSLIIGESKDHCRAISGIIESTGIFTQTLCSTNDDPKALERLPGYPVDMIFYGARQFSKQGFDWLRRLTQKSEWIDVPVLAFSSEECEESRILGLEAGANDCLSYRTSPKEAELRIRRSLENKRRLEQLRQANDLLSRQTMTDDLTGLYNRRFFNMTLDKESARCTRTGEPFSLLILDLDHFKQINDTFGHPAGDAVLRKVAATLQQSIRKPDTACRYGGEEFALLMPGATAAAAHRVAERVRSRISSLTSEALTIPRPVTVSIGIRSVNRNETLSPSQIIAEADAALYTAKHNGRNRVELHPRKESFFARPVLAGGFAPPFAQAL